MPRKFSAGTSQIKYSGEEGEVPSRSWWGRRWSCTNEYSRRASVGFAKRSWWRFVTYIVQFKVEAAGVAHRVPVGVSPPQRRRCRLTVCAWRPCPPSCGLQAKGRGKTESRDRIMTQSTWRFIMRLQTSRAAISAECRGPVARLKCVLHEIYRIQEFFLKSSLCKLAALYTWVT